MGAYHSTDRPEAGTLRAIFIAPTKLRGGDISPFNRPVGSRKIAGDFHRPYETQNVLHSTIQPNAKNLPYRNHPKA